jgi:hypothetical protein
MVSLSAMPFLHNFVIRRLPPHLSGSIPTGQKSIAIIRELFAEEGKFRAIFTVAQRLLPDEIWLLLDEI